MTKKRVQPKTQFPVDPNVFEIPNGVLESVLACLIIEHCQLLKMEVPKEVRRFVNKQSLIAGYDWENEMMKLSTTMPLDTLLKWVNEYMPMGLCRAEMRTVAKRRIEERDNKGE